MQALLQSLPGLRVCVVGVSVLGCGRTDPLWWADVYASDSDTEDQSRDGDDTLGT